MKRQATRATPAQIDLHAQRQRHLGERMIGDNDKPSKWDLLATLAMVVLIGYGSLKGWW